MTYRTNCHVDDCDTRFIGISREEYVEHLRKAHSDLTANVWDRLVIEDA